MREIICQQGVCDQYANDLASVALQKFTQFFSELMKAPKKLFQKKFIANYKELKKDWTFWGHMKKSFSPKAKRISYIIIFLCWLLCVCLARIIQLHGVSNLTKLDNLC